MNPTAPPLPLWWVARRSVRFLATLAFAALVLAFGAGTAEPARAGASAEITLATPAGPTGPNPPARPDPVDADICTGPPASGSTVAPVAGAVAKGVDSGVPVGTGLPVEVSLPVGGSAAAVVPVAERDAGRTAQLSSGPRAPPLR